ncbi:MAG: glycosyl hydrolase family 32 [Chloroflexi bacterium]|nr:glycosyl hydrolase family 32 [Chloroflexota bacterium]
MALRLPDKWVWDFWLAQDGPDYHIFYLQAPRSLQDESLRHWNVSVGHAVSQNLCDWDMLPDALHPASSPAWDDYTTWTGSIIQHDGLWYCFYTGSCRAEQGKIQRVGLATSVDLIHWDKHPNNPLIEADPCFYEQLDLNLWYDQAWRDPWVFRHPETGEFHAYITARCNYGPADERGVIAHAHSSDLLHWQVLPPVTEPGQFGQLEVPQLVFIRGRYYLFFSTSSLMYSARRLKQSTRISVTGTHYFVADAPLGPFDFSTDQFLVGDTAGSLYSGKLVQGSGGEWLLFAFHNFNDKGEFIGEISSPLPVKIDSQDNVIVKKDSYSTASNAKD